jgi:hypothetical protein
MRLPMKAFAVVAVLSMLFSSLCFGFTFDNDVPDNIKAQMINDLQFISSIQGSGASQIHSQIYGQVNGGAYSNFFETRVMSIGMNSCGSAKAVACVMMSRPTKMWLTPNFVNFSHPQVARMMVVFHEARHTEVKNGNWAHAECPTPFNDPNGKEIKSIWTGSSLAGEDACDITPLGSYGSSTLMLKNIQKFCVNCSDKVKMDAGIYADDQFKRIIDEQAKQAMRNDIFQALLRFKQPTL